MDKDESAEDVQDTDQDARVEGQASDVVEDAEVIEETAPVEAEVAEKQPDPVPAFAKRKGVFVPMVLGGLVAGGIGYGAAEYLPDYLNGEQVDPLVSVQQAQSDLQAEFDALNAAVGDLAAKPAVPDLTQDIAALGGTLTSLEATLGTLQSDLTQANDRLTVLEKRPLTEVVAPGAIAAYQQELDTLQARVADQLAQIETVAETATSEIEAAKEQAAALELQAADNARIGAATSAANAISAALASGGGYADPLAVLAENADFEIPAIITDNADAGVETLSGLTDAYPAAGRAALAAARSAGVDGGEESGIAAFFKSQLNVRSTTVQEGDGVDAILSRVEAAVKAGDIQTALAEAQTLPDEAQPPLADWMSTAQTRIDALSAVSQLTTTLHSN
ncbi:MAG: COG4223 family protein [Planktomarina sp.]